MFSIIRKTLKDEKGQAFPLALVVLAMGSLFVGGFLSTVNTSLLTSEVYSLPVPDRYSADAGVEDAIWELRYGTLADTLESSGGEITYQLDEPVNGVTPEITVISHNSVIASHDFEDNRWSGGTGWLYGWWHQGSTSITNSQNPYQGIRHVQMRGSNAYIDRAVDLTGYSNIRLQFWAKVRSFERNDTMYCMVSPNDTDWTSVYVWDRNDSDNTYHYYDIDLSSIPVSGEFWIAFDSEMSGNNDYFYIDQIVITALGGYEIISTAGERTTRVTIEITGETVSITSWELE